MLRPARAVAEKQNRGGWRAGRSYPARAVETALTRSLQPAVLVSLPRGTPLVDELHDGHGDGTEQEDVYEAFLAQDEFSHEPRGEERRGEQTDVQLTSNPFA